MEDEEDIEDYDPTGSKHHTMGEIEEVMVVDSEGLLEEELVLDLEVFIPGTEDTDVILIVKTTVTNLLQVTNIWRKLRNYWELLNCK